MSTEARRAKVDGPGKVCQYFKIDKLLNKEDLTKSKKLWLEDRGEKIAKKDIKASPRIGVSYAGSHAKLPWRFHIKN